MYGQLRSVFWLFAALFLSTQVLAGTWSVRVGKTSKYLYAVESGVQLASKEDFEKTLTAYQATLEAAAKAHEVSMPNAIVAVSVPGHGTIIASSVRGAGQCPSDLTGHILFPEKGNKGRLLCEVHSRFGNCAEPAAYATALRERWVENGKGFSGGAKSLAFVFGRAVPACTKSCEGEAGCEDFCLAMGIHDMTKSKREAPMHPRDFFMEEFEDIAAREAAPEHEQYETVYKAVY